MQVMLILILVDIQYLQKAVGQNHSPSDSHPLDKEFLITKFLILLLTEGISSLPLTLFGKPS